MKHSPGPSTLISPHLQRLTQVKPTGQQRRYRSPRFPATTAQLASKLAETERVGR